VLILTALAIKLETPGPVLFRQKRYGFNNEQIEVYKFRSMYADHFVVLPVRRFRLNGVGTGADERQVAFEHDIEELRQFVDRGLADEPADARPAAA
jgi:lipopolysaccharide/colanic/teichoic acid biosynthesis glycosyltransferase